MAWGLLVFSAVQTVAQTGGQPGAFMQFGVGARALAMGGAFYGISDDATGSAWNPAGLANLDRKEFTTMQASMFASTKYTFLGYAHPTAGAGTFALSMIQLQSSGFEKVSATFDPNSGDVTALQSMGSFSDSQSAMGLSWGKMVTDTLSFGATFKQVKRQLDTASDSSLAMDIGMMRRMNPLYTLGIGAQNVFNRTGGNTSDQLPVVMKLGNSLHLFKDRLLFDLDLNKSQASASPGWRFGGEFWAAHWFALRFGLQGVPTLQETDFGFGFHFRSLSLDIANGIQALGSSTRISASFRFGRSKEEKSSEKVKELIEAGFEAFKDGNFALASLRFNQALDADPGNRQVKALQARLASVVTFIPQAQGGEEFQTYVRKGVIAYVDGRDLRGAVNALRYAFNKNPKDEKLLGLLNMIEKEVGVSELTRRPEGPETFTFVDQKIYDARQAIYDGKYDLAIRRAQDVLDLEPANVTALEIMGSAFFMMEEKDKAKAVWKKVLEVDPNNKVVSEFLQQVK